MRTMTTERFSSVHPAVLLVLLIIPLVFLSGYPAIPTKVLKDGKSLLESRSSTGATEANFVSTKGTRSLALPFGDQHYRPLAERQLGLDQVRTVYNLAVCNGTQMLTKILQVNPNALGPGVNFDAASIYNGWSVRDQRYLDTQVLGDRWDAAFTQIIGGYKPASTRKLGRQVAQLQDKPFLNKFGQMVQETVRVHTQKRLFEKGKLRADDMVLNI
ncbi:hypothetical protein Q9189_004366 [Teloschistes chrysophthalmus]